MPSFSKRSKDNLATCHENLQLIAKDAIKLIDFTVIEGHRGKQAQQVAVARGTSKTPWPKSKHNKLPSLAFDFIPYPFDGDWGKKNHPKFIAIGKVLLTCAEKRGIKASYGGDWKSFKDYPHFQLD